MQVVQARWRRLKSLALRSDSESEKKSGSSSSSETGKKADKTKATKVNKLTKATKATKDTKDEDNERSPIQYPNENESLEGKSPKRLKSDGKGKGRGSGDKKKPQKLKETKDKRSKKERRFGKSQTTEAIGRSDGHLNPDFQKDASNSDDGGIWMGDDVAEARSSPSSSAPFLTDSSITDPSKANHISAVTSCFFPVSISPPVNALPSHAVLRTVCTVHLDSSTSSQPNSTVELVKSPPPLPASPPPPPPPLKEPIGSCPPPLPSARTVKSVSFEILSGPEGSNMKFNDIVNADFSIIEIEEDTGASVETKNS